MKRVVKIGFGCCVLFAQMAFATESDGVAYERASTGTRVLSAGELAIKVLVEQGNLGSNEVEVGEITFPAGHLASGHSHGAIEIFYVLSGTMNHVVNGTEHVLQPGDVGIVRPGDTVSHGVIGDEPVRAVVIWAPGGEVERIRAVFPEEELLR